MYSLSLSKGAKSRHGLFNARPQRSYSKESIRVISIDVNDLNSIPFPTGLGVSKDCPEIKARL